MTSQWKSKVDRNHSSLFHSWNFKFIGTEKRNRLGMMDVSSLKTKVGWVKADTKAIQAIGDQIITHNARWDQAWAPFRRSWYQCKGQFLIWLILIIHLWLTLVEVISTSWKCEAKLSYIRVSVSGDFKSTFNLHIKQVSQTEHKFEKDINVVVKSHLYLAWRLPKRMRGTTCAKSTRTRWPPRSPTWLWWCLRTLTTPGPAVSWV